MKILLLFLTFCGAANATSWAPLEFPQAPIAEKLLQHNGLANADEDILLGYLESHWDSLGYWIPDIEDRMQKEISSEFFRRTNSRDPEGQVFLKKALEQLEAERLVDPRRIADATIRELGRKGTEKSLIALLMFAEKEEREWVRWKALASVQEILARVDPTKLEREVIERIPASIVAPLLRDLDANVADIWAWTLWKRQKEILRDSFRFKVRLRTRLWLACAFAKSHAQEATEVFREGFQSQEPAVRSSAHMMIRSGIGGSLPYDTSTEDLAKSIASRGWHPATPLWETLPLPLDRPILCGLGGGGRKDLIWLSSNAQVTKSIEDVWPWICEPLAKGIFYSRVGDYYPMEYGLSNPEGVIHSRIRNLYSTPTIASHGGLWVINGHNRITEFHTDGSKLWECPVIGQDYRQIVPICGGRVILLGYKSIESRNRRGDILWKTPLDSLDDPRNIIVIDDDRFLISCTKSVGWLTRDGKYDPVLSEFKSATWIRYHPTEPWIIFEGANSTAVVYDPKTKKELGRVDLDDGWGNAKSRFRFPATHFPE